MGIPDIFTSCVPREDVLSDHLSESDFAADLSQVTLGTGSPDYLEPSRFFANSFPTRGLKSLLQQVCGRLSGKGGEVSAIFRLDTSFGGGKTHGLIALVHAARGMRGVAHASEFLDPVLVPSGVVRVAVFDGENADPANGRKMGEGVLAFTPWGELAYSLAGKNGYERVRKSDEQRVAPGAETLRELFGGEPTLILLDELAVYLRKIRNMLADREQLTAFLTSLFKAVETSPKTALVYTLAVGRSGITVDAYGEESRFLFEKLAEAESVSARKATLLNPTEDDETIQVLKRRLFKQIDEQAAAKVINAYKEIWHHQKSALPDFADHPETVEAFRAGYPFHPDVMDTLTGKTATLANFQRVRGMLRLLARAICQLWQQKPENTTALHTHHIDPGFEPIRQEIVTRLGLSNMVPALRHDLTGEQGKSALAQQLDHANYGGMPPYASYVARTIFFHSLAFNEPLKGLTPEELRYSILSPKNDAGFIDDARQKFAQDSAYLDDKPGAPLRFLVEANITQIIRRQESFVDPAEMRTELTDRIKGIFKGTTLELVGFPAGPWDLPDEVGDGRPKLAVLSHDAISVISVVDKLPELVSRMFTRRGVEGGGIRNLRNHVIFLLADDQRISDMRQKMVRRLALLEMKKADRLKELAEHQQEKVRELEHRSESELAVSIQQCYRHLFYPSRNRMVGSELDLSHTAIEISNSSEKPGNGQQQVVRALRDLSKLRLPEDEPDSPSYIRDKTPLRTGSISTSVLREEFRKDPALPMLIGNEVFLRTLKKGIDQGEFVYRRNDLVYGQGDPAATIQVEEQATLFTMSYAREKGIWPRQPAKPTGSAMAGSLNAFPGAAQSGGTNNPSHPTIGGPVHPSSQGSLSGTAVVENSVSADGLLKEALATVWEKARKMTMDSVGSLAIEIENDSEALKLLGLVNTVTEAGEKKAEIVADISSPQDSEINIRFSGKTSDAGSLKEYLEPQLRAAQHRNITVKFTLVFPQGLPLDPTTTQKISDKLCKLTSLSVLVTATATRNNS